MPYDNDYNWKDHDRYDEERWDRARDAADDLDDGCGPGCVATMCCPTASAAARRLCGCGGGVDHSECPEQRGDWRAYLDGEEVGAGYSEDEALADAESVTLPCCWDRIEVVEVVA